MRVSVVPRSSLSEAQVLSLSERAASPEHAHDKGPRSVWDTPSYFPNLYAILEHQSQEAIGILHAGGPLAAIDVGWWLDSRYHGKRYAAEAVDLFAEILKSKGVTGVGRILIDTFQGKHNEASSKLVVRFKKHF